MALMVASMVALLYGCATVESPSVRKTQADRLAAAAGWQPLQLDAGDFVLAAYEPEAAATVDVLTVYIEGDGFAWITPSRPSTDPSPRNPVGLRLALRHPDAAAAWLGRPCQFIAATAWRRCDVTYWTDRRFAEEVVAASDTAISALKRRRGARRVVLVGYSGGGAIAALVAARRDDVQALVTVAGNLDPREWARWQRLAPLLGSLDPVDYVERLKVLPQTHWVGGRDVVVGRRLADNYVAAFPPAARPVVREVPDADHAHGWVERWPELLLESAH